MIDDVASLKSVEQQFERCASLLQALDRSRQSLDAQAKGDKTLASSLAKLDAIVQEAQSVIKGQGSDALKTSALRVLGRRGSRVVIDLEPIAKLVSPRRAFGLQQEAISALGRTRDAKAAELLLENWKSHAPAVRSSILDILASRTDWSETLLSAVGAGAIAPGEIDPSVRRRLLGSKVRSLASKAERLLGAENSTRQVVLKAYEDALGSVGASNKGALVFKRVCASCHVYGGVGVQVGPDVALLTDRSPRALLTAVLDPNRAFEAKFTSYTIATKDGRILTGMIASETATSVVLKRQEGKEDVLLRSEIEELASSGKSLMPEGLEKEVSKDEMRDLLAYLAGAIKPSGDLPKSVQNLKPSECSCISN